MAGTLGAMVLKGTKAYVLSNDHVLAWPVSAIKNSVRRKDTITYPGLSDAGCTPATEVANQISAPTLSSGVDAAIAAVLPGQLSSTGEIENVGVPASTTETASVGMHVAKQGRTTGLTCGAVTMVDTDPNVDYAVKPDCKTKGVKVKHFQVTFKNQIVVQTTGGSFSAGGDSGSLIVDSNTAAATGLLFAGSTDNSMTFANPISDVLDGIGGAVIGGGSIHPVAACKGKTLEPEILLPESERLRALEGKNALSAGIWGDSAVVGIGVGASENDPMRGAIVILVHKGRHLERGLPQEMNGVPIRIEYAEPIVATMDYRCPSKEEGR